MQTIQCPLLIIPQLKKRANPWNSCEKCIRQGECSKMTSVRNTTSFPPNKFINKTSARLASPFGRQHKVRRRDRDSLLEVVAVHRSSRMLGKTKCTVTPQYQSQTQIFHSGRRQFHMQNIKCTQRNISKECRSVRAQIRHIWVRTTYRVADSGTLCRVVAIRLTC